MKHQEHIIVKTYITRKNMSKNAPPSEHSNDIENWKQTQLHYTNKETKTTKTKNSASRVLELPPFCTKYYLMMTY